MEYEDKGRIPLVKFSFEDLKVWEKAVESPDHATDVIDLLDSDRKHYSLLEQSEAAVASAPLNIGEGKGRFSKKEFVQFLYVAQGSFHDTHRNML